MIINFKIFEKKENVIGPLYHGSIYTFKNFEKYGNDGHIISSLGFHFTNDKKIAEKFAKGKFAGWYGDEMVYVVEINAKKTLKLTESDLVKDILKWGVENNLVNKSTYEFCLKTPYYKKGWWSGTILGMLDNPYFDLGGRNGSYDELSTGYKNHLIKMGYDSIEYLNEIEIGDGDRWDWIVFSNKQIKILDIYSTKKRSEEEYWAEYKKRTGN